MAKTAGIIPSWVRTLDVMIAVGAVIKVQCDICRVDREVDLPALRAKMGGSYSLLNRRCRCRLTSGCKGWNRFLYSRGVFRTLAEPHVQDRWLRQSMAETLGAIRRNSEAKSQESLQPPVNRVKTPKSSNQ
ncbi:MAG: hypothetical protein Q8R81_09370 [Novosphingobium sp.]|uniref:hypothetical protein n=1 Tax=Novosphingobium sp. TaxID=1874826 RepID=UPI0027351EF4|nr:hypothetical protein [Novosphingobium sp.]MDP3550593.1 hypothetical protein [Novosphingobium sp.]